MNLDSTIVAPATGNVISALGIVRLSGKEAIRIISEVFVLNNGKDFIKIYKANHLYYGTIQDSNKVIDEVVLSVFLSPHSFTGEDTIEITHHGSLFIQSEIIKLLIRHGATMAQRGEFSMRAVLNGKMNLSQSEAVADVISSNTLSSLSLALSQLRGKYNEELTLLREQFLNIASLLELEIDFSAEQEVFVDRKDLENKLLKAKDLLTSLTLSFSKGNAFKNGLPVAIIGKPNSGKSTLLNAILKDERAIVSSTAGTTRDTIEESIQIGGLLVRFIDTAGIREEGDEIEKQGIKRSFAAINRASVVLLLFDASTDNIQSIKELEKYIKTQININNKRIIIVINKNDISKLSKTDIEILQKNKAVFISAKTSENIEQLENEIIKDYAKEDLNAKVFVTNLRHYEALSKALQEVNEALTATTSGISSDLISENIRSATNYLGEITGEITTADILQNIFSKFCIGK